MFYKRLKPIADKYHLHVLCKIRMADLVEPLPTADKSLWYSNFGKIKAKHVDFALANPENLHVLLLLELDDSSHTWDKSRQRDAFVDQVYQKVGIPILHVWGAAGLEEAILGALPSLTQNP